MSKGRSLELFFVDGRPDGMLTAEVFDWTGHVLRLPRTQLVDGLKRPEAQQTGVYILIGQDENGPLAYIGETENMADRLKSHAQSRDWWDDAILITAARDALHKAHVKFLEARLIQLAKEAGQIRLENGNQPGGASLNEAHTANMESFLDTLHMVLPAIRVEFFQSGRRTRPPQEKANQTVPQLEFELAMPRHGVQAKAQIDGAELVVLAGSIIRAEWIGDRSEKTHYWKLFDALQSQGLIVKESGKGKLIADYAFASPSAAASVVTGRSANGRTSWKLPDGRTYAQWEEEQLNEAPS
ncbi:GIY-YIG nuclease family protein [Aliiroseovarius crassostreae]|uniref:GIY-YIG nuclease family protein n=1 Tax=Aliiroseovarius crassostreae TaxID=154981 RepID=UPI00220B646A|nr:GIY-YIG nuclease family protein [Aliiroseovarius crassostreae]UWP89959.1 GIY-YIG nuclease family protein [Aliiroseovarius crassostreae]